MIRDGLSDKSGLFFQWIFCFLGGIAIAFYYSWKLSLVIMAVAPLLGGASAVFAKVVIIILAPLNDYLNYYLESRNYNKMSGLTTGSIKNLIAVTVVGSCQNLLVLPEFLCHSCECSIT